MKKRNVKIIYQYDGSKFLGFQRQKDNNVKTVQGEIEKIILKAFSQNINMISSGRTDKGVHAIEQVSNFLIDGNIPLEAIKRQINKSLKGEVKILNITEANENFNARFDAKNRAYLYIMRAEKDITPFESNYITGLKEKVEVEKFQKIMEYSILVQYLLFYLVISKFQKIVYYQHICFLFYKYSIVYSNIHHF